MVALGLLHASSLYRSKIHERNLTSLGTILALFRPAFLARFEAAMSIGLRLDTYLPQYRTPKSVCLV